MKIERLTPDKIRIFLTYDDLVDRGIEKDDIWREIPKVHELFSDMMDQAYSELGFDVDGPLAVEVFALPAQGMVIIVTRGHSHHMHFNREDLNSFGGDEEVYEMEVTLEQSDLISYVFTDFEYVIRAVQLIRRFIAEGGALFSYRNQYILQLEPEEMSDADYQSLISILSEFGEATSLTRAVLEEYGKVIETEDAVGAISRYFS